MAAVLELVPDHTSQLHALDALELALDAERKALLEHDVNALLQSTAAKLAALKRAEATKPEAHSHERLLALRAMNQENGVLLARRRREVNWALRHMGRAESTGTYDASGNTAARTAARSLGFG